MKKKALRKEFFMEIRKSRGRFFSILFIVAIGVAFFSGIRATEPDMRYTGDEYFDEKNLMDIQIVSTLGLTEEDVQALEQIDGVKDVEPGYSADVLCYDDDNQKVVHVMSILPTLNTLTLEDGRMPENTLECVVDAAFIEESGFEIGDKIKFTSGTDDELSEKLGIDTFTIVGSVSSPLYVSFQRGNTTIGTGSIDGFVGVMDYAFALDVYTEIYASVDGAMDLTAFTEEYTNQIDRVKDNIEVIREDREEARDKQIRDEAYEELNKAREEYNEAKAEVEKELADAETELTDGKTQLEDAKIQAENAQAELINSGVQLDSSQAELDANITSVNAQKSELDAQYASLASQRAELQQQLTSVQAQKADLSQQLADLNAQKDSMDPDTYASMEAEISAGLTQISESEAQLQAGISQIDDGLSQVNAGLAQINAAQSQFAAAQAEIDDGRAQIAAGEQELAEAQAEIAENEQKLAEAQEEFDKAKAEAEKELADGAKELRDAEAEIEKIDNAKWYINDRDDLTAYTGYGENADRMRAIGEVFPVLFFLVAALISLTTMTRMVEEQRTQIGTLKALGYSRGSIAAKYLGYAFIATILGCIVGVLFGEKVFPYVIITAYGIMYPYVPNVVVPYECTYALMAAAAALVCTMFATYFSCYKELKAQAAELMRPPAPKKGKRVFLERIPFVWKRLNFTWKATVRNLVRYKKRFFMTLFGIGSCMGLLLVGFGLKDSIFDIGNIQYHQLQFYEGNMILNEDAEDAEKEIAVEKLSEHKDVKDTAVTLMRQVTIGHEDNKGDVYMIVPKDVEKIPEFIVFRDRITHEAYTLEDEGIIITEKMAKKLEVEVGDSIYIKDDIKGEPEVTVLAICENYMSHYIYMTPVLYENVFGEMPEYNSVYYQMAEGKSELAGEVGEEILVEEGALSISYTEDLEANLNDILGALNIVVIVLIIAAGMLAYVVLYNLNNINITERKRELATLKVLGFYPGEVAAYVYRENILLTVMGTVVGVFLGKILHQFIIVTVEVDNVMFGRNLNFSSYVVGFLVTLGFSALVNGVMYFKLKKIDMIESLKSVE